MGFEQLQFIISRYDHYYDAVNNKGQFFLGLNTFIIGGLGAAFLLIKDKPECSYIYYILFILLFILSFVSITFTLIAILPYLKSNHQKSLVFFGSVAEFDNDQYVKTINNTSDKKSMNDFASQAHHLAVGLKKKYRWLQFAGWAIAGQFIVLVPFLFTIFQLIINHK